MIVLLDGHRRYNHISFPLLLYQCFQPGKLRLQKPRMIVQALSHPNKMLYFSSRAIILLTIVREKFRHSPLSTVRPYQQDVHVFLRNDLRAEAPGYLHAFTSTRFAPWGLHC